MFKIKNTLIIIIMLILLSACPWATKPQTKHSESIKEAEKKDKKISKEYRKKDKLFREIDFLIKKWDWACRNRKVHTQKVTRQALRIKTTSNLQTLISELKGKNTKWRIVAASALGFTKDKNVAKHLLQVLNESNFKIVRNALMGLGILGIKDIPLEAIKQKVKHKDSEVRAMAVFALGKIASDKSVKKIEDSLIKATSDINYGVRNNAVVALGELKIEKAVMTLVEYSLYDKMPIVRYNSARSLGLIKDKRSIPHLIEALENENQKFITYAIAWALRKITKRNFKLNVKSWKTWWQLNKVRILSGWKAAVVRKRLEELKDSKKKKKKNEEEKKKEKKK